MLRFTIHWRQLVHKREFAHYYDFGTNGPTGVSTTILRS
jgi:hypothetical protein